MTSDVRVVAICGRVTHSSCLLPDPRRWGQADSPGTGLARVRQMPGQPAVTAILLAILFPYGHYRHAIRNAQQPAECQVHDPGAVPGPALSRHVSRGWSRRQQNWIPEHTAALDNGAEQGKRILRHRMQGTRLAGQGIDLNFCWVLPLEAIESRCGPLAQLAEQLTLNQWVRGSSPWWVISLLSASVLAKGLAQSGNSEILSALRQAIALYACGLDHPVLIRGFTPQP